MPMPKVGPLQEPVHTLASSVFQSAVGRQLRRARVSGVCSPMSALAREQALARASHSPVYSRARTERAAAYTHVARIAHARRKFFGVGTTKSPIAEHELRHIQALYAIKAGINSKPIASVVLSIGGHPPTPRFPAHRGRA